MRWRCCTARSSWDHLDTAASYTSPRGILDGEPGPPRYATERIREALAPYDGLVVTTKVGPGIREDGSFCQATTGDELRSQVEENLRRLGREQLDVVNLRIVRKAGQDSVAERFEALAAMQAEGLIRHLGPSNVRLHHLDEAQAIAPVVCVQNSVAIDNRTDADLLRECGERGIAFVPFFTLTGARREQGAVTDHDDVVSQVAGRTVPPSSRCGSPGRCTRGRTCSRSRAPGTGTTWPGTSPRPHFVSATTSSPSCRETPLPVTGGRP